MALIAVPQSNQNLQQTQTPILNNFTDIEGAFVVDHVNYNLADQGKHNKVTFPPVVGGIPVTSATEIALFNQTAAPSGNLDLWIKFGNDAAFPMTGSAANNTGAFSGGNGWMYYPSSFLSTWGKASIVAGGTITITFASAPGGGIASFPGFQGDGAGNFVGFFNLTRMNATPPTTNYPVLTAITLTTFTVTSSDGNNLTFMWNVTGF